MTVKEYSQYLLDNFPHDAPMYKIDREWDIFQPVEEDLPASITKLEAMKNWWTHSGFPEGVDQIVVL